MAIDRELGEKLEGIFMPHAVSRKKELMDKHRRLVHYTSAENAIRIIQSKHLWMRNTQGMSDYSEVRHGFNQLHGYFQNGDKKSKFIEALDRCSQNAGSDAIALFDQWWGSIQTSTYISCLSEHYDHEDHHGRLSMWRAFGRDVAGVAIVLNTPEPYSVLPLRVFLSPVAYFTSEQLSNEIEEVIINVETNRQFLKELPREQLVGMVYMMFMMAVVSLKHHGFHEEREWRLIHSPTQFQSDFVSSSTEIVGGIPQIVHKIKFENQPDAGITGIELPQLLDRVIIGPSQYAYSIYESLVRELIGLGVENAASKVVISDIPLRG